MKQRAASDISRTVGDVVLGYYKRQRYSQATLSARTGITTTTLRRLIAGEAEFNVEQLWIIANVLGVPAATILEEATIAVSVASGSPGVVPISSRRTLPHAATADPELDADHTYVP